MPFRRSTRPRPRSSGPHRSFGTSVRGMRYSPAARRSRLWTSASQIRLADGTQLDLRRATGELEQTGGRHQRCRSRVYAGSYMPADRWELCCLSIPRTGSCSSWSGSRMIRVYTDGNTEEDPSETLALHAAAFGPALAQRAVQATLVRARIDSPATVTDGIGPVATPGPGRVSLRSLAPCSLSAIVEPDPRPKALC